MDNKIKFCPFRKGIENVGYGGAHGNYPTNQVEYFMPCIGETCMAWNENINENKCKLMKEE